MYLQSLPVKNVIGVFQVVLQKGPEPPVVMEGVVVVVVVVVIMGDAGLASDGP